MNSADEAAQLLRGVGKLSQEVLPTGSRYVVSVDERGEVTMIPAEPKRN
jgi:hypothetical protein